MVEQWYQTMHLEGGAQAAWGAVGVYCFVDLETIENNGLGVGMLFLVFVIFLLM